MVTKKKYIKILNKLNLEIYADGADYKKMLQYYKKPYFNGFTTNPSLMRKSGVKDYSNFCINLCKKIKDKPISFEVFADDLVGMKKQAVKISSYGKNVYVKIPISNTKGHSTLKVIQDLNNSKIPINITAVFTLKQVKNIFNVIDKNTSVIISIFAGRIADSGIDPIDIIKKSVNLSKKYPNVKILWASPREVINIFQANEAGCHIITVAKDIIDKFENLGKNLEEYSLDTVKMFYKDALKSKFKI